MDLCPHVLSHLFNLLLFGLRQIHADAFAIEVLDLDVLRQSLVFLDSSFLLDLALRLQPAGVDLRVELFDLVEVYEIVVPCPFFLWLYPDGAFLDLAVGDCLLLLLCLHLANLDRLPQIDRILVDFWLLLFLSLLPVRKESSSIFGLVRK